jgi:nucleotide-binding universal stress UspA family protein
MTHLFNHLLLATEHSEFDVGAEKMALAMAGRCQLPISVVFPLVSNPEYETLMPQIAAKAEREAAVKIAELRSRASAAGVAMDVQVRRGEEPYQEIVEQARTLGSDLIIIRRRGKRGMLANLLVGEMVSKVVAHAPCPVLIVPRESNMWSQGVLVAADPTEQGRGIVEIAASVAAECALPLHLVCVVATVDLQNDAEAFVAQCLRQVQLQGVTASAGVKVGKTFDSILSARTQTQSDLIVIGSRSDHRIGRALLGGVAQKVMGLSEHPVLVLQISPTQPNSPHE